MQQVTRQEDADPLLEILHRMRDTKELDRAVRRKLCMALSLVHYMAQYGRLP